MTLLTRARKLAGPDREVDAGPFSEGLFGGLPRTATSASATSSEATIVRKSRSARQTSLSAQATKSSSVRRRGTPVLLGASLATDEIINPVSSAPYSATEAHTYRRSLSDRLTLSLISAGLVCGITPSLTRKRSGQPILVLALDTPAGRVAEKRRSDSSFSSADAPAALNPQETTS